jgi:catechol 2,3-dioxygenase-like lactoylglutathione lyase family enzyme
MAIRHVRVVSIPVADEDRAKAFYVDQLGFEVRVDAPFAEAPRWVEVVPPNAETSLSLVTWFDTMPPGSLKGLVLECDNIEATYDLLGARGVIFHGPIARESWGVYATFNDVDGNGWVLAETPPQAT